MKYAIILPDGAADEPVEKLGGRTPLEAAATPNMDWIALHGRQGRVRTVPAGMPPGSDIATLSLLGYDPRRFHAGRAPLEAAARGILVGENDLIFRCNLVTIVDGMLADFSAGHIGQAEADQLIVFLNERIGDATVRFHTSVSYRNLLTLSGAAGIDCRCTPPNDIPDQPVAQHLPRGAGAERLIAIQERAAALLTEHEINQVRRDLGENPANAIWLWGQGRPSSLETFQHRFGVIGAAIAAVDLIRGLAIKLGFDLIDVPGATGYLDTNYRGKGAQAIVALENHDLAIIHIEAPDEAGHNGDIAGKVRALEQIDEGIVGPLLDYLRRQEAWKILVAPDHPTPVCKRVHTDAPPPFCLAGSGVAGVYQEPFSEANAAAADLQIEHGHELMEYFLKA